MVGHEKICLSSFEMKKLIHYLIVCFIIIIVFLVINVPSISAQTVCNVGSASGNDTSKIQSAINSCAGGGEARLTSGQTYTTGTLELASGVTLNLNNATIQASANENDFHSCKGASSRNFFVCTTSGRNNVTITGPGSLTKTPGSTIHHSMIEFWNSSNLTVKDITIDTTMADSSANGFHLNTAASNNITIDGVTIRGGRAGSQSWGNDGIDIQSSQNVVVKNCDIDTHDDGIAIASSDGSGEETRDVLVTNCRIADDSSAIKFGTGSDYDFSNIIFDGITIHDSNGVAVRFSFMDGGNVSNVTLKNITVESSVKSLFGCGGGASNTGNIKNCMDQRDSSFPLGTMSDITLENFEIYGGSSNTGHGDHYLSAIDRLTFKNMHFHSGSGSSPLTSFRDICGLSISGFTSHLSGNPTNDLNIASSVSNLRLDGGATTCGGIAPTLAPSNTPVPTSSPIPSATPVAIPGDVDGDGDVDIFDYNILVSNFGATGENPADIDGDNDVDIFDYNILIGNFGSA